MEIKKFYKEMNNIEDISEDYVEIRMSQNSFARLKVLLETCNVKTEKADSKRKAILKELQEAEQNAEVNWY